MAGRLKKTAEGIKNVGDAAKAVATNIGTITNSIGNVAESLGVIPSGEATRDQKHFDTYGGLTLPVFTPGQFLATDLFTDSSQLTRTNKASADSMVESIEEKKQTLRVIGANLELNTEVLKTGVKSEKMQQSGIDYGIARINTDTKLVNFDVARTQNEIALTKLDQTSEKLAHERVTLEGLRNETDQRKRFWLEKYNLGESRIKEVELARYQLDAKIGAIETEAEAID